MKIPISILLFFSMLTSFAQQTPDTLILSRQEAEAVFLKQNMQLLASKLHINETDAQLVQTKLWPNPSLSIGDVNLWSNSSAEKLPPLFGSFGRTSQIALELEQLIQTAGKRRKLIAMERVEVEMAKEYFADLLGSLKAEFRNKLTDLQFEQQKLAIYQQQLDNIRQLLIGYENQYRQGNVGRAELLRLKALKLEFGQNIAELQKKQHELQREIKTLLGSSSPQLIELTTDGFLPDLERIQHLNVAMLIDTALQNRADLKAETLASDYATNKLAYEKALSVPDLSLNVNYDRGGNIMRDFVGIGLSLDLPFFNRNQGKIRMASIQLDKQRLFAQQKQLNIQAEVAQVYHDLRITLNQYQDLDPHYEEELEKSLISHYRSFVNRHIGILEYLDFLDAYLSSKSTILTLRKELNTQYEELQYRVGIALNE